MTTQQQRVDAAAAEYGKRRSLYERLVEEVLFAISAGLSERELKPAALFGRTKTTDSFREKMRRKQYTNPLSEVTDLAGVRLVCLYDDDREAAVQVISSALTVVDHMDKTLELGVDKMGYVGSHLVIELGPTYSGARYNDIASLKCEVQVRTVLQDAWALISHHLVYKSELSMPNRIRRDLNNVSSLLEIAQGIFDTARDRRAAYLGQIRNKEDRPDEFLSQPLDHDTLLAYTIWKFPGLPVSDYWHNRMLMDLDFTRYPNLRSIDDVVASTRDAVEAYRSERPSTFLHGTDFLTKSLGFVDSDFREKHSWSEGTTDAFAKFAGLLRRSGEQGGGSRQSVT